MLSNLIQQTKLSIQSFFISIKKHFSVKFLTQGLCIKFYQSFLFTESFLFFLPKSLEVWPYDIPLYIFNAIIKTNCATYQRQKNLTNFLHFFQTIFCSALGTILRLSAKNVQHIGFCKTALKCTMYERHIGLRYF